MLCSDFQKTGLFLLMTLKMSAKDRKGRLRSTWRRVGSDVSHHHSSIYSLSRYLSVLLVTVASLTHTYPSPHRFPASALTRAPNLRPHPGSKPPPHREAPRHSRECHYQDRSCRRLVLSRPSVMDRRPVYTYALGLYRSPSKM